MNSVVVPTLGAALLQITLGVVVFQANRHKRTNQCFLLLSVVIAGWLVSLYFAFTAQSTAEAAAAIRQASVAGIFYLAMLNLLRLSVRQNMQSWGDIIRSARIPLLLTTAVAVVCQTKFYLRGAELAHTKGYATAHPIYGHGIYLYGAFFLLSIIWLIISYIRDIRETSGRENAELGFILAGGIAAVTFSLVFSFVLELFFSPSHLIWVAPGRVFLFSIVVAYGIATRKIMEVGAFMRRAVSYGLLALYLALIYAGIWWASERLLAEFGIHSALPHFLGALAVALSMTPARGVSKNFADKLFVNSRGLDFQATVSKAAGILSSVTTLRDLLDRFATTTAEAVGTDRSIILLPSKNGFTQPYAANESSSLLLADNHPLIEYARTNREPIVLDELHRIRPTPELELVMAEMRRLKLAVVIGIFSRHHLAAVMLLGPRLSGRIYGRTEQNALQVLCGQLAIAIENAQLFTEVQNAKIYNETLLRNLTTGVVAADRNGQITVFNNEAEQITDLDSRDVLERPLRGLPAALGEVLQLTLESGQRQENQEVTLPSETRNVVVRVSSSIFHDEDGAMLGVLMVLTDITALKRLELQIRRSDRLASLGTLSAGMAHEIKNPLVSIKTFAQLLPERYQDSDFRETFSNLIGHEIDRIDSLVNQLLRFARPTKPLLKSTNAHTILEKSLQLVGHRLYQKDIKLTRQWGAGVDTIRADADQLEQVFLNFFINAMDAMKRGGELVVSTEVRKGPDWLTEIASANGDGHSEEGLRITIRDNGEGIRPENLAHVFDPFFTTKDYGTGLGLSVVHGIVQEHGGQIEVESELHKGTAFHILLPMVRFDEQEVAA